MGDIKTVAVIGASGYLGKPVVKELLAAGFSVTALTRVSSTASFPEGVTVQKVNYDAGADALKRALTGQDAVVSTVASAAAGSQVALVEAAHAAGVKRFIPSEFGINTRILGDDTIAKILAGKIKTVDRLQELSEQDPVFSWTGLTTGLFFEMGLEIGGLGLDFKTRTATIYDSGNQRFATSTTSLIGRAVAAVLTNPAATRNKYLSVASFTPTQNELFRAAQDVVKGTWTVTPKKTANSVAAGEEKLARGDYSAFRDLLKAHLYADGGGHEPRDLANGLLGLPEEDLRAAIEAWLAGREASAA